MRCRLIPLLVLAALPVNGEAQRPDEVTPMVEIIHQERVVCKPQRPTANRPSPYDSTEIVINGQRALICYSRPSSRGRTMIGGTAVPFGRLWRTGANEPTTLHIPFAASIAGVQVAPGTYSIYTVPGEKEWEVIVNRATSQWGHENRYSDEIKSQEVGRGKVPSSSLPDHVETFTVKSVNAPGGADLVLEWEKTRVAIPIRVPSK
jgi:hypothetical protein